MKLFRYSEEFQAKIDSLQDLFDSGEIDYDTFRDTLESVEGEREALLLEVAKWLKELNATRTAINEVLQIQKDRLSTIDNKIEAAEEFLIDQLEASDTKKLSCPEVEVSRVKNGGKQPIKLLVEPDQLPDQLKKLIPKPDMETIRDCLEIETHKHLAERYAKLDDLGYHLRIK